MCRSTSGARSERPLGELDAADQDFEAEDHRADHAELARERHRVAVPTIVQRSAILTEVADRDAAERRRGHGSFVYGALTPRVAVSRGLVEGVTAVELRAVLTHERYHVENLDPLKLLVAQTLSAAFYFLPSVRSLRSRSLAGRELAADRCAVNACGRRPLASALLKVLEGPAWVEPHDVAAIGGAALLDVRVAQLETGVEPKTAPLATTRGVLSLVGAALFAAALLASGSSLGVALSTADLLNALICAAPFGGAGMLSIRDRRVSRQTTHPERTRSPASGALRTRGTQSGDGSTIRRAHSIADSAHASA